MDEAWRQFLGGATPAGHGVQVYRDVAEVAGSLAEYLAAGFDDGEPAIVVATPGKWERFADALAARDFEPSDLEARGLLVVADAETLLRGLMGDGGPSTTRFERTIGALLDGVEERHPGKRVRVFGEMVDLLCRRGRPDAAVALEACWNELAGKRDFSLLCAYHLDVFDRAAQVSPLAEVCRLHSHMRPDQDPARLHRAVDLALDEILGPVQAGKVYAVVAPQLRRSGVPVAQLALSWVTSHMPNLADRVLARARAHYLAQGAAGATG